MSAKRHLKRVAEYGRTNGCVVCQAPYAHLHHSREDVGMAQRANDWLCMPLCLDCHTGPQGIHGDRSRWKLRGMDEGKALALTLEAIYGKI